MRSMLHLAAIVAWFAFAGQGARGQDAQGRGSKPTNTPATVGQPGSTRDGGQKSTGKARPTRRGQVFHLTTDHAKAASDCLRSLKLEGVQRIQIRINDDDVAEERDMVDLEVVGNPEAFDKAAALVQVGFPSIQGAKISDEGLRRQGLPPNDKEDKRFRSEYVVPENKAKIISSYVRRCNPHGIETRASGDKLIVSAPRYGQALMALTMQRLRYDRVGEEKPDPADQAPKK